MSDHGNSGGDPEGVASERPPSPGGETTVQRLEPSEGEGSVELVGTAHVSSKSVEEVEGTIAERRPDVVAVELDEGRYRQMKGETPEDLDASDLLHGNTVFQFLAYWMLSYVQTRLGERFDIKPGADMMAAVETAEEHGLGVALVDRDIQTTIQRFWRRLSTREKATMFGGLLAGMFGTLEAGLGVGAFLGVFLALGAELIAGPLLLTPGLADAVPLVGGSLLVLLDGALLAAAVALLVGLPIAALLAYALDTDTEYEEFDIEELTDTDVVSAMMEEFRQFSPGGAEALIDERDAFIAHRLVALREAGYDVVAVVGAGHRAGIQSYLDNPERLPSMESITGTLKQKRFSLYKLFGYLFTVGFAVFFGLLVLGGAREGWVIRLLVAWFLVNGIAALSLAKLAGAHWPSALVGGGIAWLTSVNPLLAPGWFAGYVELRYIDVNIADISTLNEIVSDEEAPLGELYSRLTDVPLFRLIAIVAMTNVGSMIASYGFVFVVLPYMSADVGGIAGIVDLMLDGVENGARIVLDVIS
ncbi:TraB/GumN family protein [Halapricum desulfuricans]|uniref:Pheromone shutdown protein TraB, contains GTxH motif n=1 Tax=Halapricum desulfuricans TaxID=2841257 RepID=A0A897NAD0_9EURY|nr:TraB/GumN family protein [Halapricum desulfuricans]QSG09657.1 Pheromone shutdown protein TraB, contains GTxH motif [Halapricum desulfuricans]